MMMTKEVGIAFGAVGLLLVAGGVAYAASGSSSSSSSSSGSLVFKSGHRYEVDLVIPPNSVGAGDMPSAAQVQKNLDAIAAAVGAFKVVSVGVTLSSTTSTTGGFTFWMLVDAVKDVTVSQSDLLAGSPTGTTITATDEGLSSSPYAPVSTGKSGSATTYSWADAIPVPLGTSPTIPVGSSLRVTNPAAAGWVTPGVTSDNYLIVAKSSSTVDGFVATGIGKATLTGSYVDSSGQTQTGTVVVTVVAAGTGAISSSGSTSSSGSAGATSGASTPASTSVTGSPSGLASPGPPATTGWTTKVVLGSNDVTVTAWPGDSISIALPAGATWASSGSSNGFPTSGSDPFLGTYSGPIAVTLAWTLGGQSHSTTLTFATGRTWGSSSAFLLRYDTVRISLSADDWKTLSAGLQSNQAENAAITAAEVALAKAGVSLTTAPYAELFRMVLLAGGPFDTPLAINIATLKTWVVANALGSTVAASSSPVDGTPLPSDWPSDSGGVLRAEFQYTGDGLTLSTLPYTLSGWVRLT